MLTNNIPIVIVNLIRSYINVILSFEVGSNVRAEGKHVIHLDIKLRLPPES